MSNGLPGGPPADGADELRGPTVLRMILGAQLRRLREAADVTPDQAGYEIRASRSKISRMEHGRVGFKDRDVTDLLTLYGITDEQMRARMLASARHANAPGWWSKYDDLLPDWFEQYLGLEGAASVIRTFELQFVHGLFQIEAYARAVTLLGHKTAPADEIDRRVSLRLKRQEIFTSPELPQVWSVMDEAVLRRAVGGRAVMRAQLERLAEVASLPQVTIQTVPFGGGGHAAAGVVGDGRGCIAAVGGRTRGDARPAGAPCRGRQPASGHDSGGPVRRRRSRCRGRLVHHLALR